ncbi:uncharacterized protein RSE6_12786 [Rhynchosporium secalis]|uniref:Uncharacterized protein n=1 Tax=Rhynchosporium secalis TaxID=38038 RepID=A0A1E1MRA9_RHYSE|nr:uncharacterized protein RSE6_12786 [Rhynchosporium secalis]
MEQLRRIGDFGKKGYTRRDPVQVVYYPDTDTFSYKRWSELSDDLDNDKLSSFLIPDFAGLTTKYRAEWPHGLYLGRIKFVRVTGTMVLPWKVWLHRNWSGLTGGGHFRMVYIVKPARYTRPRVSASDV